MDKAVAEGWLYTCGFRDLEVSPVIPPPIDVVQLPFPHMGEISAYVKTECLRQNGMELTQAANPHRLATHHGHA